MATKNNIEIIRSVSCQTTMKLFGDYWTLRIIDGLQISKMRFCELQRNLNNLNPVTLTSRLKKLEEAGLVTRSVASKDKISVEYSLTDLGTKSLPIIQSLTDFALTAQSVK